MNDPPPGGPTPEGWARRNAGWVAVGSLLIGGWMAVLGPGTMPRRQATGPKSTPPGVMTPGDLARWGNESALKYLRSLDDGRALATVERARKAVVRFEITVPVSPEFPRGTSTWGSGVLVNGGRHVLTAGHVLESLEEYPNRKFRVTLIDGRTFAAMTPGKRGGILQAPEGDWGVVELVGLPPKDCASLSFGDAPDGGTVVMLGYSDGWSADAGGTVVPAGFGEERKEARMLMPLVFVGTMFNANSGRADILAGIRPAGGASGGAVIDLEGRLVGVMTESNYFCRSGLFLDDDGKSTTDFQESIGWRCTPVRYFRAFVEEQWKR